MRKFRLGFLAATAMLVMLGVRSPANAISIDLFDQDQAEVIDSSATLGGTTGLAETVLAGTDLDDPEREIFVEVTGINTGTVREIHAGIDGGVYAHSQETGAFGFSILTYTGFGSVDLTQGGALGVVLNVVESDLGGVAILSLTDGLTNTSSATLNIPEVTFGSPQTITFLFTDFAGIDTTDITQIVLEIDGRNTSSLDVTADFIQTAVPEPGTLLLLGSGLLGLGLLRRRRIC